ncbi:MAG: hypothetical protein B6I38_09995 [Anaerolineaceae bacterium 4572_5.1]|nr:MAG: hypothetical protein B5M51_06455 [Anaerolinea sp. 4484_236]OQY27571.1 MAG: hypothetical protein B6I38_09995 [Anaerolineaceae bacterium 4572_5.1]RLD11663.1 MAG: GNAT family N-acetyltransferase [Chloroflexota bacterium]
MNFEIYEMNLKDYDKIYQLWEMSEDIELSQADSYSGIEKFLKRNPSMSFVAWKNGEIAGAVLCGNDGRRGYIHHLMVHPDYRHQGLGRSLVGRCLYALTRIGIQKCHLFIFEDNKDGMDFWESLGWTERVKLTMMSQELD